MNPVARSWTAAQLWNDRISLLGTHLPTERLKRLFAVACYYEIWPLLTDERSRTAVTVAERYADGNATSQELLQARIQAWDAAAYAYATAYPTADAAAFAHADAAAYAATAADTAYAANAANVTEIKHRQAQILASFSTQTILHDSIRTTHTTKLAHTVYDSKDFGLLPILADAIEEAGFDNPELLRNLRDTSFPHYRGSRILDFLRMPLSAPF